MQNVKKWLSTDLHLDMIWAEVEQTKKAIILVSSKGTILEICVLLTASTSKFGIHQI